MPQWNRTPAQGVLTAHFLVVARTCLRHKKLGSIRSFTFSTGDNHRSDRCGRVPRHRALSAPISNSGCLAKYAESEAISSSTIPLTGVRPRSDGGV